MVQLQLLAALLVISVARQTESQLLSHWKRHQLKLVGKLTTKARRMVKPKVSVNLMAGRLAVMVTPAEAIAVLSSIALASSDDVILKHELWIGLNDRKEENVYEWEDGRQVADTIDIFGEGIMHTL
ncbi:hypothetical protein CAPTEDRAFT_217265 [Capitella teleta]|uniref:C-type lectin domain-containing protein n=1 Tax=Capitella teleta TaxID=283909 RepID=R7TF40_CAPTE|nr:hypothetical protein CAPTEDRAFT_217265 [Capitella teleta]|eukprot:ELT89671.1 hypothetical protein CAPTEDRAFT_217265 [Capitella teleta]